MGNDMSKALDLKGKKIPITLGCKQRTLKFDLNSFAEIEDMYGSVDAALKILGTGSIKAVRNILWAGLIHEELDDNTGKYKITPIDVGAMIELEQIPEIATRLKDAMGESTIVPDPLELPVEVVPEGNVEPTV